MPKREDGPLKVLAQVRWQDRERGWSYCPAIISEVLPLTDADAFCSRYATSEALGVEMCRQHAKIAKANGLRLIDRDGQKIGPGIAPKTP